jgi:hypothetical protein
MDIVFLVIALILIIMPYVLIYLLNKRLKALRLALKKLLPTKPHPAVNSQPGTNGLPAVDIKKNNKGERK